MFWKFGFHTPSAIEGILDRDEFTLEDLLDDEDVLQECRNQNTKLITFLGKDESMKQLLAYVTKEPAGSPDDRTRFKYANVASELLTTDTAAILDYICTPESLDIIWGVLDGPAPMNPLIASYFTKLIMMLLNKRPELVTGYMYEKQMVFNKLISHLGTSAIMDIIRRMTTVDSGHGGYPLMQWLAGEKQLVAILVGLFEVAESGADEMILTNAATLMQDLVIDGRKEAIELQEYKSPSTFLNELESEMHLSFLLKHVFHSGNKMALDRGLPVILTLLDDHVRGEDEAPPSDMDIARHADEVKCIMKSLVPCVTAVHTLLNTPTPTPPNGRKALGAVRLNAARVIEAMLAASYDAVQEEIMTSNAVPTLLALFEEHTENNFLHRHVTEIVRHICSNFPEDPNKPSLFKHLFTDCKVMTCIIRMFDISLAEEKKPKGRRHGYTGHLINMANFIVQTVESEHGNPIEIYFPKEEGSEEPHIGELWHDFRTTTLEGQNQRWEIHLGGQRPRITLDSDEDEDDDDDSLYPAEDSQNADLAFTRFLHQRVTVDMPNDFTHPQDDDGDFDSDDDSDEDVQSAADLTSDTTGTLFSSFGKTGVMAEFVDPVAVNNSVVSNEATDWDVTTDGAAAADDDGAEAAEVKQSPVPPLDLGGDNAEGGTAIESRLSAEDVTPLASSTPVDAAPKDWANFEAAEATTDTADTTTAAEPATTQPEETAAVPVNESAATAGDTESSTDAAEDTATPAGGAALTATQTTVEIEGGGGLFNSSA